MDRIESTSRHTPFNESIYIIRRVDVIFVGQNRVDESTKSLALFWLSTRRLPNNAIGKISDNLYSDFDVICEQFSEFIHQFPAYVFGYSL